MSKESYFDLVRKTHAKFGIDSEKAYAHSLSKEEYLFRIGSMFEELWEYVGSVFDFSDADDGAEDPDEFRKFMVGLLSELNLRKDIDSEENLEIQMDSLLDLEVFTVGTAERQSFNNDEGFRRVMAANHAKELAGNSDNSKRGFKIDMVKPEGWKPPYLKDLVQRPKGIIVLEGPDGSGKTSIADNLVKRYGAVAIHATWSPELEERMDEYLLGILDEAEELSKNQLVVIDRHFVSEFVYSDVFRKGTQYPDLATKSFDRLVAKGAAFVFCIPMTVDTAELYLKRFEKMRFERDEMYDEMVTCMSAFQHVAFGYGTHEDYQFNLREGKCNFMEVKHKNGMLGFINTTRIYIYDIEIDPEYEHLTEFVNQYIM